MKQLWIISMVFIGAHSMTDDTVRSACNADLQTRITIISDPHYYDPSLGTEGPALEAYLSQDRKLLRESAELLNESLSMARDAGSRLILFPGDLTKDGTLVSHRAFAAKIAGLEKHGIQVLVVPGNHDVSNGEALSYMGDSAKRVPSVGPEEFSGIYNAFGYGNAISRDSNSLSYLAEPIEGLWVLGLDACLYDENDSLGHPHTGGRFKDETLDWLISVLSREEARGKTKIAMMHHGILEHYNKQARFFEEYVVEKHNKAARLLARLGVRLVFTGHYHANDITLKTWRDGAQLFDIETGSLVTWPCPVRHIDIAGDSVHISTRYIESIPSMPEGFVAHARSTAHFGICEVAERTMVESLGMAAIDAQKVSGQIGDAFLAHYHGDEIFPDPFLVTDSIGFKAKMVIALKKKLVRGLYTDLPPADNQVSIALN